MSSKLLHIWALASGMLMAIGSLEPWLDNHLGISLVGIDQSLNGTYVFVLALVAISLVLVHAKWRIRIAVVISAAAGAAAALLAIHDFAKILDYNTAERGLYATLLGAASLVFADVLILAGGRLRNVNLTAANQTGVETEASSETVVTSRGSSAAVASLSLGLVSAGCGLIVVVWVDRWMGQSATSSTADLFSHLTLMTAVLLAGPVAGLAGIGFASSERDGPVKSRDAFMVSLIAVTLWFVFYVGAVLEINGLRPGTY